MRKCLLALLFTISFAPLFSQTVYSGQLAEADPKFNRPNEGAPPTTLSITGTDVSYKVFTIDVASPSMIMITASSVWDNFMILYGPGGFNPATPLENALLANDDFNGPNAGFTYDFTVAGTYTLVLCSYKNGVTGSYSVSVSAPTPLPLKLLSFTATKGAGNTNIVKWTSAEESNLSSYQVQVSTNNTSFTDLKSGYIAAKNSATTSAYNFTDNYPARAYNYYRLKITERSGHIAYSPVALVRNIQPGLTDLHVFPNPSVNYVQLESKAMQNNKVFVSVINAGGQTMQSGQYNFNAQGLLSIDVQKLPSGRYFLSTSMEDDKTVFSFIKN